MRKEIEITIEQGRDAGKTFKIVEMSAVQTDRWATKALCLLGRSNQGLEVIANMSMVDFLMALSQADPDEAQPLLDELLACSSFKKDGSFVNMKGQLVDSVIEDFSTIFRLRLEALKLHLDFLEQGGESVSK